MLADHHVGRNMNKDNPVPETPEAAIVVIETSMGQITAELWADKAPATVSNFLQYVDKGHYDGVIFHRVIPGFMNQGGGMSPHMQQKTTCSPVQNEASADVPNDRGTLAMARTGEVHSATAQFFINHADNSFLNHTDETASGFGYCVFGKVTDGLTVIDEIAKVKTHTSGYHENVPVEPVVIASIRRAE